MEEAFSPPFQSNPFPDKQSPNVTEAADSSTTMSSVSTVPSESVELNLIKVVFITAKLALPLVIFQKLFYHVGSDWYAGNYIRKHIKQLEKVKNDYNIPDCLRSVGRLSLHIVVLMALSEWISVIMGLSVPPCYQNEGCHWYCTTVWLLSIALLGHAVGEAIAQRGGILKLHLPKQSTPVSVGQEVIRWLLRPNLQFWRNWRHPYRRLQPFDPRNYDFPASKLHWRLLQFLAVVQHMRQSYDESLLGKVLLQQVLVDEWCKVLFQEKRVGWALVLMFGLVVTTLCIVWDVRKSRTVVVCAPAMFVVLYSSYTNVQSYFDRRSGRSNYNDSDAYLSPPLSTIPSIWA